MRATWVAHSVKLLALGFSSGHDLRIVRLSPSHGEFAWDALPLPLPLSLMLLTVSLSLFQIHKYFLKRKDRKEGRKEMMC